MSICKFTLQGMNNVSDPSQLPYEVRGGFVQDLASDITNFDTKTPNGVRLRRGYTVVDSRPTHSGWSDGEKAYFVNNGNLCCYDGNSITTLKKLTTNDPASFCKVNNLVVMNNGSDYLVIDNGVVTEATPENAPFKVKPPAGQLLCFYNGRLYIASGKHLVCCDTFSVDNCDERQYLLDQYMDDITLLAQVDSGLFVGTETEVCFLAGSDPYVGEGFTKTKVLSYGAIRGTSVETENIKLKLIKTPGSSVLFASTKGICVGLQDGSVVNLSSGVVEYKHDFRGSAMLREENGETHYVVSFPQTFSEENIYIRPSFDVDEKEI